MTVETLLPLILFALVSTITPGGATTLATASGAHFGFRRSIPVMAGFAVGLGSMAGATAAGLGGVLLALPVLQIGMKTLGSLYLIWLAIRIGRSGPPGAAGQMARPTGFVAGLWMLWHNPKGWAMTMGAAASFAALAENPVRLAILLGGTFCLIAAFSLAVWCLLGQMLGRLLKTAWQWRAVNISLACLLMISIIPMWHE
ncbi:MULTISPECIES: LysE family translocator [Rhizobium]|uniref:LysE family translocator n=1 Tax=Rhizobium tropici TaxID=398 RepID=A0A329YGI2_RHITR|nr:MULTISPECIES: LysE family translocator [Rhizobium]MBB3286295.1 threonine/homoserine/homoserine lactone efflux protein [Rhizobium sp. BK252]MBB3400543.1 threonine/homoserine/homoserine lactone efflux protein [Rhizobium sp. BK289]MBB3413613.1 threonine/homoserine/homoserine lactone efflux protein [Rhizobium sp. BK284]MBB3481009.1 threonine/homoserine/homoserine lactone efflux protein [Rhizobium sp. BK347]MDK4720384.1 LysE family translocator [Rhizobium sp. CNPSo 3968]